MLQTARQRVWHSGGRTTVPIQTFQIVLKNVPRTATPTDIRREITKAGAKGVQDDYKYFKPTERAFLTLVSPEYLENNLRALTNLTISGIPIESECVESQASQERPRMRGHAGRSEAAQRGRLNGHGPRAGLANDRLSVILGGLPGRTSPGYLAEVLQKFKIAQTSKGEAQIVKIPLPPKTFSLTAKFLITMTSIAEAHRVVRKLHGSQLKLYGEDIPVTAKLIH